MIEKRMTLVGMILSVILIAFLVACDSDNDDNHVAEAEMDIVDTAIDAGSFNTLVAAVQAAGLEQTLRGPGPFTVFAPTDDAFGALPPGTVDFLLQPANIDILTDILTYHVYGGSLMASDVIARDGMSFAMLNGGLLNVDVVGGNVVLNQDGSRPATITTTDITASNGVIHVLDIVLAPEDSP